MFGDANIHESKYAYAIADFISKMQIALKECYKLEYWLELLNRTVNTESNIGGLHIESTISDSWNTN